MSFKFEKYALGGFGDNTVVDVDALPTENIDQSKIYRVTGDTETTYGIPDEADNKTVYEHTSATGWKELGAGEGGTCSGGIIDVTELPEVGVEGSVYRVTTETETEVWGIQDGIRSNLAAELPNPPTVYIVDNLPDVMEPYNMSSFIFPIYVLNDTGIGYVSADGTSASAVTFGSVFGFSDKGWVDDINSIDATLAENNGLYYVRGGVYYTYHTYSNGDWVNYKEAKETVLYYLNEGGETYTANVGDYTKYGDFYQIAEEYNGKPVTILGNFGGAGITNLSIPSSITKISASCFNDSAIRETVYIPSTVTELGEWAFAHSRAITKLNIHMNTTLTEIPSNAFSNCNALREILNGTGATGGGYGFPNSITSIGDGAFYRCAFGELKLHKYITSIGANAFGACVGLNAITYTGTKAQWKAITFGENWDNGTGNYIVTCTDGTIAKDGTET